MAVPRPLRTTFEYSLPSDLPAPLPGTRVRVPFGKSHVVGIVTALSDHPTRSMKPIEDILDAAPILTADLLKLASWLSDYYHHPIGAVYAALIPTLARRGNPTEFEPPLIWIVVGKSTPTSLARAPRQRRLWESLANAGPVTTDEARKFWATLPLLRKLEERGAIVSQDERADYRISPSDIKPTSEQTAAIRAITANLDQFGVHTLYGVTGSGKTEVYLRVIENALKQKKQALLLVPEIALTPQTTARFVERFGAAGVIHSAESDRERFRTWARVASGEHQILIGTRSAIFSNFRALGVIVVDEEHDPSFKQTEGLRYSARDVAVIRAQMLGIPCVLGSATPSLETIANVDRKRYSMAR
ncbi:MAG: DEAD/DEAH box helicase, partial [Pseudomonadota bacterium]|nr:DEAD/DEAH box helicase [Pseudomonadota bacterium]